MSIGIRTETVEPDEKFFRREITIFQNVVFLKYFITRITHSYYCCWIKSVTVIAVGD